MRHRFIRGALLATSALLAGAAAGLAQAPGAGPAGADPVARVPGGGWPVAPAYVARGQGIDDIGGLNPPLNAAPTIPIPTGNPGQPGFYTSMEFVNITQTRTIGSQIIAYRGLVDSGGRLTGLPGTYLGNGQVALTTDDLGRTTYTPGFNLELGYKFENGLRLYANYMRLFDTHYTAGASLVPPYFRDTRNLLNSFLVAGVYNFPPEFSGPQLKTQFDTLPGDPGFNAYGIWNGATVMNIRYTQRYTQAAFGARMPLLQTEYSRVYGIAEGKFAWLFDRFQWYTASYDVDGNTFPQDAAWYTNTLSQRLYGPVVGCGHEIFLANSFSLSCDLTGGLLLGVVKERDKYKLETPGKGGTVQPVASKRSNDSWELVPNANANINLWWYPVEGVQLRVGYQAMTYFNTVRMEEPVGFNYGAIDPRYETQVFRLLHGFNVGVGLFF